MTGNPSVQFLYGVAFIGGAFLLGGIIVVAWANWLERRKDTKETNEWL